MSQRTAGQPLPRHHNDLTGTHEEAWGFLVRGAADRRAAFHTPAVATIGLDGRPRVRTVVLRQVEPRPRVVRFHTDVRSAKIRELERDDRIALHFYDPGQKIQIRLDGRARLWRRHEGSWAKSREMSRICYAQVAAPGTPIDDPAVAATVSPAGDAFGVENFVAVDVAVTALEWLYLDHAGHRRASYEYREGNLVSETWLAP